ncbi:MAG: hypothetical protein HC893_00245 [Chloroflexaceae bacterium]|nr:hypothetical protein [Chloroflexaceae bacterium]NJL32561.1 hypothetical protein [Chloroflexaceae bacterium]NJO07437.1 hypothetical protein [Chloroflexaceae bacterium]
MYSDMISKIEKARMYAREPERVRISALRALFHGSNSTHEISLRDDRWTCDCEFFANWGTCQHVMAMQKMLAPMLSETARELTVPAARQDETVSV